MHLGDFGKAVRDLEALELADNFCGLDVFVKVNKLDRLFDRIGSESCRERRGKRALGGIADIDKGQLV